MANRLQLKRGTTTPGNIFYAGEPVYNETGKVLYIGDAGGTGTGAGSSVASYATYAASLEMLYKSSSADSGAIRFYEDTDNGTNFITLKAPAAVTSTITLTLPDSDGDNGNVLTTDGNGNLSFSTPSALSFTIAAETGTPDQVSTGQTITFAAGEGINTDVTNNTITISGEAASATNAGIASYTSDFHFIDTWQVGVVTATSSVKGIASFDTGDFVVTTGAVALGSTFVNTVTTDTGVLTPSNHSFSLLGGEGINVTHADSTITVEGEDATTSNKGIASFSDDYFTVTSGAVTLKAGAAGIVTSITGTANEVEVTNNNNGTYQIGLPDNVTIGNDLTVTGNLRVVGTAVTFETQVVKVEDRLIELGLIDGGTDASTSWDLGVVFNYGDGAAKKSGVFWMENQFVGIASAITIADDTGTTDSTPQVTISTYAPVAMGSLFIGGMTANEEVINSSRAAVNLTFDGGSY
jgi:hypothetical protein